MFNSLRVAAVVAAIWFAVARSAAQSSTAGAGAAGEIDACGTLVQVGRCVLFSGAGGQYVLAEFENFKVGDAVRVIGTIDPGCNSICTDADGCISGATLYDPAVLPCGTPILSLQDDLAVALVDSACTAASGAIAGVALVGLALTRTPVRCATRR